MSVNYEYHSDNPEEMLVAKNGITALLAQKLVPGYYIFRKDQMRKIESVFLTSRHNRFSQENTQVEVYFNSGNEIERTAVYKVDEPVETIVSLRDFADRFFT